MFWGWLDLVRVTLQGPAKATRRKPAMTRNLAKQIFAAGVTAANPTTAVEKHLSQVTDTPSLIIAVGKAAGAMIQPAMAAYPAAKALAVTNYENATEIAGATVFAAGHPVPDAAGAKAAAALIDALQSTDGPVLALISGGGSALLPAPVDGVTLAEKAQVNSLLLGAGLDIVAMNLVRQQLSRLKGGGLLGLARGPLTALILSDVVGDDLSAIASGPTVAPLGTAADAVAVLQDANIWDALPASVQAHLQKNTPPAVLPDAKNMLIGSNAQSVAAMQTVAPQAHVIATPVEGDVADAARLICDNAGKGITLWGGETTVVLQGDGRGGRNQELALRIAIEARARGWENFTCLQGGTDGRDGPTDAAGGLVDQGTLDRINDLDALLANNDSYAALTQAGDLLMWGATGTNVADLGVLIRT